MDMFGLLPREIANMRRFALETLKGDVQIIAPAKFRDIVQIFQNLTREEFAQSIQRTYVLTLNQMPFIRNNVGIVRELERYLARLEKKHAIQGAVHNDNQGTRPSINHFDNQNTKNLMGKNRKHVNLINLLHFDNQSDLSMSKYEEQHLKFQVNMEMDSSVQGIREVAKVRSKSLTNQRYQDIINTQK